MRYSKARLLFKAKNGVGFSLDARGVRRRIEALQAIGWSAEDIARACGWKHRNDVNRIKSLKWVERKTFDRVAEVFERMSMTPGPSAITRKRAKTQGYISALGWDDIDADELPHSVTHETKSSDVDEVMVDRILDGDFYLASQATLAERACVVERWTAAGLGVNELARQTGWKVERYYTRSVA